MKFYFRIWYLEHIVYVKSCIMLLFDTLTDKKYIDIINGTLGETLKKLDINVNISFTDKLDPTRAYNWSIFTKTQFVINISDMNFNVNNTKIITSLIMLLMETKEYYYIDSNKEGDYSACKYTTGVCGKKLICHVIINMEKHTNNIIDCFFWGCYFNRDAVERYDENKSYQVSDNEKKYRGVIMTEYFNTFLQKIENKLSDNDIKNVEEETKQKMILPISTEDAKVDHDDVNDNADMITNNSSTINIITHNKIKITVVTENETFDINCNNMSVLQAHKYLKTNIGVGCLDYDGVGYVYTVGCD